MGGAVIIYECDRVKLALVTLARPKSQAMFVMAHRAASAISGSCSHTPCSLSVYSPPSLSAAPLHPSYISPFPSLPALPSLPFSPLSAQLSIFETAAATPQLSTLTALVTQAGLAGVLTAPGNYTVFAPVNTAFAAIPAPLVNWLTNSRTQNAAALSSTLLYHVLGSVVYSNVIVAAGSVAITPLCASCLPPLNAYQNPVSGLLYIRTGTTVLATITLTVRGDRFLRSRSVGGAGGRCGCGGIVVAPMP